MHSIAALLPMMMAAFLPPHRNSLARLQPTVRNTAVVSEHQLRFNRANAVAAQLTDERS